MNDDEFRCIGAYNPSGLYPSTLIPVFEKLSGPDLDPIPYHQIYDTEGRIIDFDPIEGTTCSDLAASLEAIEHWNQPYKVGMQRCFALTLAEGANSFFHFSETEEEKVSSILNDVRLFRNPLAATILIRQLLRCLSGVIDEKKYLYSASMGRIVAASAFHKTVLCQDKFALTDLTYVMCWSQFIEPFLDRYNRETHRLDSFDFSIVFLVPPTDTRNDVSKFWSFISTQPLIPQTVPILVPKRVHDAALDRERPVRESTFRSDTGDSYWDGGFIPSDPEQENAARALNRRLEIATFDFTLEKLSAVSTYLLSPANLGSMFFSWKERSWGNEPFSTL